MRLRRLELLVKTVAGKTEFYQCEKCGHTYPAMEKALLCESNPVTPFQYKIGDMVLYEKQYQSYHAGSWHDGSTDRAVVEDRWIHGLSEKGEPAHGNMYKLRPVGEGKGLIITRFEDQILRKM